MHCSTSLLVATTMLAAATASTMHAAPSIDPGFGYYGPTTGYNSYGYGTGTGTGIGGGGYAGSGLGGFGSFTAFQSSFFAAKLAEHDKAISELVDFKRHHEVDDVSLVKKNSAREHNAAKAVVNSNNSGVGNSGFGGIGF